MRGRWLEELDCLNKEGKKKKLPVFHFGVRTKFLDSYLEYSAEHVLLCCIKEGVLSGMQFQIWAEDVNCLHLCQTLNLK